jgi:hypothetical protein
MPEILHAVDQYQLQCVSLADANASLLAEWQSFRHQSGSDSWMHDPEWLTGYFEGQTANLRLYSLYQSGSLAGIAPFLVRDWPMIWHLGEVPVATFPLTRLRLLGDNVAFPEDERAYDSLFTALAAPGGGFDTLFLEGIPTDSYLWNYLHSSEMIRRNFLAYEPEPPAPHPILRVQGSFEEYMGKYSSKSRNTLTRKVKKFREGTLGPMRFARFERPEDVPLFMEHAVEVSRKTYQWIRHQRGLSATELITKRLLFAAQHGSMRSYLLYCGDSPCAFLVGYQASGRFLLDEIGFDPAFAKHSAGTVLQMLTVEDLFKYNSPRLFDLGDYGRYKEVLSTESYMQGKLYLFRRGPYMRFLRTGHRSCQFVSSTIASTLDRFNLKTKVRQFLRGWKAPQ